MAGEERTVYVRERERESAAKGAAEGASVNYCLLKSKVPI